MNDYIIKDDYAILILKRRKGNNLESYVDIDVLNKLIELDLTCYAKWSKTAKAFYVYFSGSKNHKPFYLHRYILKIDSRSIYSDHINHNTLDNRRKNLRSVFNDKNIKHREHKNSNNTSGYRNISFIKGYWRLQLQIDGKNKLFKEKFEDVDLAGEFAEEMRRKYYGEFAGNN